jgi:hypothetical protein
LSLRKEWWSMFTDRMKALNPINFWNG